MSKRILRALVQATIAIIAFVIVYNYVVDTKTAENIRKSSEHIQKFITDEVSHIQGLRLQYNSGADVFKYANLTILEHRWWHNVVINTEIRKYNKC